VKKGKLIVIEGIDGSGKATQVKLLADRLIKEGGKVLTLDFPRYGEKAAFFVEKYLRGEYGPAKEVGPYIPSAFYALDRFDAKDGIEEGIEKGMIIISNRYVSASLGHQGGKIKVKKKRDAFIDWLTELEFGIFKIPKPDLTVLLDISPKLAQKLVLGKAKRKYIGGRRRDIHESDLSHLKQASEAYRYAAQKYGWVTVNCMNGSKLRDIKDIESDIYRLVGKFLKQK
jgi:dTMP kinase